MTEGPDDQAGHEPSHEGSQEPAQPQAPPEERQFEESRKGIDILPKVDISPEDAPQSGNLPPADASSSEGETGDG